MSLVAREAESVGVGSPGPISGPEEAPSWSEIGSPFAGSAAELEAGAVSSRVDGAPSWLWSGVPLAALVVEAAGALAPGPVSRADEASSRAGGVSGAGALLAVAALSFSSLRWALACAARS